MFGAIRRTSTGCLRAGKEAKETAPASLRRRDVTIGFRAQSGRAYQDPRDLRGGQRSRHTPAVLGERMPIIGSTSTTPAAATSWK